MEHPEDYVDSFVECYYKEFKNYPFPKERNGYKTCYDRMFTEVSEEEVKKYIKGMICIGKSAMDCYEEIEKLIDMGHEKIWFCMYHDLLGSGKYGC